MSNKRHYSTNSFLIAVALTDEYSDVRKEAAIALGNLENTDALNALQQALDDPDRDVSIYAERAIKKIQNLTS